MIKKLFFGHPVLMSLSDPPMLLVSHSREPDILWHTKPYRSCQAQSQSTQLCPFHDYGIKKQPDITMGDFKVFCFKPLQCLLRPRDFRWFKRFRKVLRNPKHIFWSTIQPVFSSIKLFEYILVFFSIICFYSILGR